MSGRLRVALVSYLNALPFRYGLSLPEGQRSFWVEEAVPSRCAELVHAGAVDIALLPLAELDRVAGYSLFSSFCIGSFGPVRTVCLFSNTPAERLERIYLDGDSRTSASLIRYLAGRRWSLSPQYCPLVDLEGLAHLGPREGVLLIGDKVFSHEDRYAYRYDLALEWRRCSHLPAVFAVWVMRDSLVGSGVGTLFDSHLAYGVSHLGEALAGYAGVVSRGEAEQYLTDSISYWYDLSMVRGAAALGSAVWR